ncbi:hypothetical protein [Ferrovum myxofaciens]|uniref:hypothetical protein n=1 Tax=Ferrovum myxofaciens TaxID=416213 RepID=UPI001237671E|nr:hypothetical protein [Ferrovum myxofaciens]
MAATASLLLDELSLVQRRVSELSGYLARPSTDRRSAISPVRLPTSFGQQRIGYQTLNRQLRRKAV